MNTEIMKIMTPVRILKCKVRSREYSKFKKIIIQRNSNQILYEFFTNIAVKFYKLIIIFNDTLKFIYKNNKEAKDGGVWNRRDWVGSMESLDLRKRKLKSSPGKMLEGYRAVRGATGE